METENGVASMDTLKGGLSAAMGGVIEMIVRHFDVPLTWDTL